MAAVTPATTIRESCGSLGLLVFNFSSVADADTFASGLDSRVVAFWANAVVDEGTAGDEGVNVANSSGTFTFYKKTAGATTLNVWARI